MTTRIIVFVTENDGKIYEFFKNDFRYVFYHEDLPNNLNEDKILLIKR